mmetsp:Transcript_17790/g.60027  ORF Transcript_17790/g.60027 Transcript_17790/m.60027 type:complete len:645 (-) Transcript_17790:418-2352(-)
MRPEDHGGDGDDHGHDAVVFVQAPVQVVVVRLQLLLLEQHDLGSLGDLGAHAVEALGFADQLQQLHVEIHVQLLILRVADDQRRLEAALGRVDGLHPRLVPEVLKGDEGARELVVHAYDAPRALAVEDVLVRLELFHGLLYAFEQMAAPRDIPGHRRQVPRDGRVVLLRLVQLLDLLEFDAVVLEDDVELGVEVALQRLPLQDGLELVQQIERILDGGDVLKRLVDKMLQQRLQVRDLDVELDVVPVELVVVVVEQVVPLLPEVAHDGVEVVDELLHALELVVRERLELVDGGEHVDELDDAAAEEVELAEDLHLVEIKLLPLGVRRQLLLRQAVLLLVRLRELEARLQLPHQLLLVLVPQRVEELLRHVPAHLRRRNAPDRRLAVHNHLVRDAGEERGHPLLRRIVPRDGVDHLDGVCQRGERVDDRRRRPLVQRLDEPLQGEEVLDVILRLVGRLGDVHVRLLPPPQQRHELLLGRVGGILRHGLQQVHNSLAVLALQLLGDGGQPLHSAPPVVQLLERPDVLLVQPRRGLLEVLRDLAAPAGEQLFELRDQLRVHLRLLRKRLHRKALWRIHHRRVEHQASDERAQRFLDRPDEVRHLGQEVDLLLLVRLAPLLGVFEDGLETAVQVVRNGAERVAAQFHV